MDQADLFHETIYDAYGSDIAVLGGFKAVARLLFPGKTADSGYAYLKNALREDHHEKLGGEDIAHLIKLAAEAGSFATMNFLCDNGHLHRTTRKPLLEEQDELAARIEHASKLLEQATRRLAALQKNNGLKAV